MIWFLILFLVLISAVFVYSKRFTSKTRVYGFYFVQFYYLMIVTPIGALSLINIGLDIVRNPEVQNLPLSSDVLLSLYILSVLLGVLGSAIHSSTTSLAQALERHTFLNAFEMSEEIHGPVSHEILFSATISSILLIGLLGVNHPIISRIDPAFAFYAGVLAGLICSACVLWSTHVGLSLITTFLSSVFLIIIINILSLPVQNYPYVMFALTTDSVVFVTLLLGILTYLRSKRATKIMIKIIFPKGHPIHQTFSVF